jgi:hypothetical protein
MFASCSYETVKYVQIQDPRLGILRFSLLIAIAAYVVFFELWSRGGYLESTPVVGVVRFSLQQPTIDNCDPTTTRCSNAFAPLKSLPYCQQHYNNKTPMNDTKDEEDVYPGAVYPCEIYEALNAQLVSEHSLVVITRASTINQTLLDCATNENDDSTNQSSCPNTYQDTSDEYKFYTAQSEAFTILFDHAVTASKFCSSTRLSKAPSTINYEYACSSESSSYHGRLFSRNDDLCRQEHAKGTAFERYRGSRPTSMAPCYIQPNQTISHQQDFFSLDVLLLAAGVNLDDCQSQISNDGNIGKTQSNKSLGTTTTTATTTTTTTTSKCQTYRDSGGTLLLNVYWNDFDGGNFRGSGLVEPYYYYAPQFIARSSYKQSIPFYFSHYRKDRTVLNAHGIKVAVLLSGEFHQSNILVLLITLTTGLGLLALATAVVDSFMLYVLPEKERYQQAKFETTTRGVASGASGDDYGATGQNTNVELDDGSMSSQAQAARSRVAVAGLDEPRPSATTLSRRRNPLVGVSTEPLLLSSQPFEPDDGRS